MKKILIIFCLVNIFSVFSYQRSICLQPYIVSGNYLKAIEIVEQNKSNDVKFMNCWDSSLYQAVMIDVLGCKNWPEKTKLIKLLVTKNDKIDTIRTYYIFKKYCGPHLTKEGVTAVDAQGIRNILHLLKKSFQDIFLEYIIRNKKIKEIFKDIFPNELKNIISEYFSEINITLPQDIIDEFEKEEVSNFQTNCCDSCVIS